MTWLRHISAARAALLLLLVAVGTICAGCVGDEPDNVAGKPWNSPAGWQNGMMPSYITQPH